MRCKNMESTFQKTLSVTRWGTALGIRFPAEIVRALPLKEKELVNITLVGNEVIIKRADKQPRKSLAQLFEMYPTDYIEEKELDWGKPMGDEVW